MRTLKFRVYNFTRNEMTYDLESIDFGKGTITQVNTAQDRILFPDKECEVMQWTGLTDRHGKEIYEGDIVKIKHQDNGTSYLAEVYWQEGGFETTSIEGDASNSLHANIFQAQHYGQCKVIGNIYENPELLEKEL